MPINDFADMMPHTVLVTPFTGTYNSYGKPDVGTPTAYTARVSYMPHRVLNTQGEEVVASGEIWLQTTNVIRMKDTIEWERDTDVSPSVYTELFPMQVDTMADDLGTHHVKIHFR